MSSEIITPFRMKITIHKAIDLPIADITTSDPYVVILLDDNEVGRTSTIYRNHVAPEWNTTFENIPIQSIYDTDLVLRVYDEDQRKSDDILGIIRLSLSSLPPNQSILYETELSQFGNRITAKGKLIFSVELMRNDYSIKIHLNSNKNTKNSVDSSEHTIEVLNNVEPNLKWTLTEPVMKAFEIHCSENDNSNTITLDIVNDSIKDVSSVLKPLSIAESKSSYEDNDLHFDTSNVILRRNKNLFISSGIDLKKSNSFLFYRVPPIQYIGLSIILDKSSSESWKTLAIDINNKYKTWKVFNWLYTCFKLWSEEITLEEASSILEIEEYQFFATLSISPDYGLVETVSSIATSIVSNPVSNTIGNTVTSTIGSSTLGSAIGTIGSTAIGIGTIPIGLATSAISTVAGILTTWTGIAVISLSKPYTLDIVDPGSKTVLTTFNMKDSKSLYLSVDSSPPTEYAIVLDTLDCDYQSRDAVSVPSSDTSPAPKMNKTDEDFGPKGLIGFRRFVRKTAFKTGAVIHQSAGVVSNTVLGATTGAVTTVSTLATGVAKGVISTAVDAARTIASGDARHAISSAQRTVVGYGKELVNFVANTGVIIHGLFDHPISYLVVKHGAKSFYSLVPTESTSVWDSRIVIDIDTSTILRLYQPSDEAEDNLDIFLYHGIIGSESLISQRNVKISKFLNKLVIPTINNLPKITHISSENEMKVTLHSELGLFISILDGRGIMQPQQPKAGGMFVKVKLVDALGKTITTTAAAGTDTQHTKIIFPCRTDPDWGGSDHIFLQGKDGLDRAVYVRLQICGGLAVNPDNLGFILIPIEDFSIKADIRLYPVIKYKKFTGTGGSGAKYGFGELRVKIQKIIDRSYTNPSTGTQPIVKFAPSLVRNSIYLSMYPCGAMLGRQIMIADNSIENFFVSFASADSLILVDVSSVTAVNEDGSSSESSNQANGDVSNIRESVFATSPYVPNKPMVLTDADFISNNVTKSAPNKVELIIYENQRRQFLPPYDWSNGNLCRTERSHYSDESGKRSFPIDSLSSAPCPPGYQWNSDWRTDKTYTPTDELGWTYGFTFDDIMANYGNGVSSTSPTLRTVRRRKWVREAVLVDKVKAESLLRTHSNESRRTVHRRNSFKIYDNQNSWRQEEYLKSKAGSGLSVLSICQERAFIGAPVNIPWSAVTSSTVLTPGVLCINANIHRFFGLENASGSINPEHTSEHGDAVPIYREASIELFVTNCPASQLKSLIDERVEYDKFRQVLKTVVAEGNCSISKPENSDSSVPDTVELSTAAQLYSNLDHDAVNLELKAKNLQATENSNILRTRALRLRLYQACLLSAKLTPSSYKFTEVSANFAVDEDIKRIFLIEHEDEIYTVTNRIDYLIDIAEARIRDAVIFGWYYRNDLLLRIVQVFVNRYLFEMVNLLSKFFTVRNMQAIKGLQGRITLISTFSTHNDRLEELLMSIFKLPYDITNITILPKPRLSLFLAIDQLLSWYAIVLQQDMSKVVLNAVSAWKDVTSNKSASEKYTYPLPWIPLRERGNSGPFRSLLPEDTVSYLNKYLEFARLRKEDMAASLVESISDVDRKVALSYAIAFQLLAETYWAELSSQQWNSLIFKHQASGGEDNACVDELVEKFEWLCSVTNDARRVVNDSLINRELDNQHTLSSNQSGGSLDYEVNEVVANTYTIFTKTMSRSLEYLSCIIMYEMSISDPIYLDADKFAIAWDRDASNHEYGGNNQTVMTASLKTLKDILWSRIDGLDSLSVLKLLRICIDKIIIRFLYLLKSLHGMKKQYSTTSNEIESWFHDKNYAVKIFFELVDENYQDVIINSFKILDQVSAMLSLEESDEVYASTIRSFIKIASGRPSDAQAIAELLSVCYDLRIHPKHTVAKKRMSTRANVLNSPERGHLTSSFFNGVMSMLPSTHHQDIVSPTKSSNIDEENSSSIVVSAIQEIRENIDESEIPNIEEYEQLLCNPSLDASPVEASLVSVVVKVFYLSDIKTNKAVFSLSSFLLDSVYHSKVSMKPQVGTSDSPAQSRRASLPLKYVSSLFSGASETDSLPQESGIELLGPGSGTIVISKLKAFNLFCLDIGRKPATYMTVFVTDNPTVTRSTVVKRDSMDPDWSINDPLCLPVASSSVSSKKVKIVAYYKNRWSKDEVLGSIEVPLLTLNISPILNQDYEFDMVDVSSTRVIEAYNNAKDIGVPLPKIRLSLSLIAG